jgi:integrase
VRNDVLAAFETDLRLAGLSPVTIKDRLDIVRRLAAFLAPVALLAANDWQLIDFQREFAHLAPASVDIYVRHVQAFYRWAVSRGLLPADPSTVLIRPKLRRGRPHPTALLDLQRIFACTQGPLRMAYALAAFAGARRGEICRLQRTDLDLTSECATARLDGKGGKERTVPLIAPLVRELLDFGVPRTGYIVTTKNGRPYPPRQLSTDSHWHLQSIGVHTTLHSLRHAFATTAYQTSHDLLLVKELLGHESVATTEIYAEPDMSAAHVKLKGVADQAGRLLAQGAHWPRLRSVGES